MIQWNELQEEADTLLIRSGDVPAIMQSKLHSH